MALASKGPIQGRGKHMKKKKDMLNVKCFNCGELGHYSAKCPQRKKEKEEKEDQQEASSKIDRLSSRLEEDFLMFTYIPPGVTWGDLVL